MLTFTRVPFDPLSRGWPNLASDYQGFHSEEPWNEYLWCPTCNAASSDRYGPVGTTGLKEAQSDGLKNGSACLECEAKLELFWSETRTRQYIEKAMSMPGFFGSMLKTDRNQVVAWAWGYSCVPHELTDTLPDGSTFYVDAIAVLPEYQQFVKPMVINFLELLMEQRVRGFTHSCMRTHREAASVRSLAILCGYKEAGVISEDDPTRNFWTMELKVLPKVLEAMRKGDAK